MAIVWGSFRLRHERKGVTDPQLGPGMKRTGLADTKYILTLSMDEDLL
jgi:hypothetical protein